MSRSWPTDICRNVSVLVCKNTQPAHGASALVDAAGGPGRGGVAKCADSSLAPAALRQNTMIRQACVICAASFLNRNRRTLLLFITIGKSTPTTGFIFQ